MLVFGGVYTATNQGPPTLLTAQLVLTLGNLLVWSVEIVDSVTNSRLTSQWNQPPENERIWNPKSPWRFSVFRWCFPQISILGVFLFASKLIMFQGEIVFFFVGPPKQKQHGHHRQQQNFLQQPMATVGQKVFFLPKSGKKSPTCRSRLMQLFQEI